MRLELRAKKRAGVLAAAVVVGAAVLGAAGGGGPAGADTLPGGTWGQPQAIPGLAALAGGQYSSDIGGISCASLGNCTAFGDYFSADGSSQSFVVTETDGVWGSAQSLADATGASTTIALQKISCGAPGYCTASGSNGQFAFLATEVKGAWSVAKLPGTIGSDTVLGSGIGSLACTGAGDCTVVGWYEGSTARQAFTLDESSGTWGTPQPVAGLPSGGTSSLQSVSCSGPGDCTAGGYYDAGSGHVPFLVSESGGTWGSAQEVPGFAKLTSSTGAVTSVSCPDASDCAVAGSYHSTGGGLFTTDEVKGTWDSAKALDVPADASSPSDITVGCRAAGNCVITGTMNMTGPSGTLAEVIAATETSSGGSWGQARALPGVPVGDSSRFGGLSCVPRGDCSVAGAYYSSSGAPFQVFAATIAADGTIGAVQPVQAAGSIRLPVQALSCPQDGYCTLGEDNNGVAQLVTEANPASVTLAASPSQVSYGSEPAETFTATVSSAADGTPTGTVAVTGPSGAACTITLAGGTGKCSFSPAQFPVGAYTATGTYNGDLHYVATSGTASVTVAKGKSATRLTPSSVVVAPGQGASETLAVTVGHASGTTVPTGTVTVKDGSYAVCTVTLAKGSGSCAVNADQVITHGLVLTAAYPGDSNFLASTSPPVHLTIAPAGPRLVWPAAGRPAGPVSRLHGQPAPPVG